MKHENKWIQLRSLLCFSCSAMTVQSQTVILTCWQPLPGPSAVTDITFLLLCVLHWIYWKQQLSILKMKKNLKAKQKHMFRTEMTDSYFISILNHISTFPVVQQSAEFVLPNGVYCWFCQKDLSAWFYCWTFNEWSTKLVSLQFFRVH